MVNVNNDTILKIENEKDLPLSLIIDPPCEEFILNKSEIVLLIIKDSINGSNVIHIRYGATGFINIDVDPSYVLLVETKDEKRIIWGWER